MSKTILVIASDFPYPPNHGGRVDVFDRLKVFKKIGYKIYLISTIKVQPMQDEVNYIKDLVEENFFIQRSASLLNVLSFKPYQLESRNNKLGIVNVLDNLLNIKFDICFIEGHYCLDIFQELQKKISVSKTYLRVQNDEKIYFKELSKSTNNILKKIFYNLESLKFSFYEKKVFNLNIFEACLHISSDEHSRYKKNYKFMKNYFLPASVDTSDFTCYQFKKNKTVLFVGSLFMPNNIEGLRWYLKNIHGSLCQVFDDYKLLIAGNTKGINVEEFNRFLRKYRRIEFIDSPESLDDIYFRSCVFINPMLSGAGVKLKTINAVKFGLPIVSTKIGNEGTGLIDTDDIVIAENEKSFLDGVIYLLRNENERKRIVINSQTYIKKNYDQQNNLNAILGSQ